MGYLFIFFGYIFSYLAILAIALSIAISLYYCAELAEEYPSLSGKIIKYSTGTVLILHLLLCVDGLPLYESFIGFLCHLAYASLLRDFPFIKTLSLEAILSVSLIFTHAFIENHNSYIY